MSDPYAIFRNDTAGRQNTLKVIWPELYDCLAQIDGPAANKVIRCALGTCSGPSGLHAPAVARLFPDGPPACSEHIRSSRRSGGWPLERTQS
jgi:hypothetical protein